MSPTSIGGAISAKRDNATYEERCGKGRHDGRKTCHDNMDHQFWQPFWARSFCSWRPPVRPLMRRLRRASASSIRSRRVGRAMPWAACSPTNCRAASTRTSSWKTAPGAPGGSQSGPPGGGARPPFFGILFGKTIGVEMTHVAYRGTALGLPDLLSGQIPIMSSTVTDLVALHKAGKIRIVGASGHAHALPAVPTFKET